MLYTLSDSFALLVDKLYNQQGPVTPKKSPLQVAGAYEVPLLLKQATVVTWMTPKPRPY